MKQGQKAIIEGHRWLDTSTFNDLMARYVPEVTLIHGPFGGHNYGDSSIWDSYTIHGAFHVLIKRLVEHIAELEAEV